MCDTLGFLADGGALFAKNSDRSPNEPQTLEFHPARTGLSGHLRATYISLPEAAETHAALLSRPAWMWGAEMGVNDCGVCIGNEAVFTRGAYAQTGLTGMDLVRLALERSDSAKAALEQIIALLEQYGQGGNCGFDHDFFYDNAFLILDRSALYVLETAGKQWVYKQYQRQSISNRLSIRSEGDACSGGEAIDFCRTFTEPVYTRFSGSRRRRAQTQRCLKTAESVQDCMNALRTHDDCVKNPFARGSVSSVCMHYGGMVGDHTTASMIVSLEPERTVVWATGSSAPCVSLFKPYLFGSAPCAPVFAPDEPQAKAYWLSQESFRRALIGKRIPKEYYAARDALEAAWRGAAARAEDAADFAALTAGCAAEEHAFFAQWDPRRFSPAPASRVFFRRWQKKTEALERN